MVLLMRCFIERLKDTTKNSMMLLVFVNPLTSEAVALLPLDHA